MNRRGFLRGAAAAIASPIAAKILPAAAAPAPVVQPIVAAEVGVIQGLRIIEEHRDAMRCVTSFGTLSEAERSVWSQAVMNEYRRQRVAWLTDFAGKHWDATRPDG